MKGDRRTKQPRIQDLRFLQGNTEITGRRHRLHQADIICITFRDKKNGEKDEMITLSCTKDTIMCPVKQGEMIINNLWELMGTSPNTIIYTYLSAGVFYTQTAGDTAFGRVQQEALDLGATNPRPLSSIPSAAQPQWP